MVDTIEPKDDGITEAQNKSTLDTGTTDRPSWLPEKFESAEAMAKSYSELEKEYSNLKNTQTPQEQVAEVNKATGLSLDNYFNFDVDKCPPKKKHTKHNSYLERRSSKKQYTKKS